MLCAEYCNFMNTMRYVHWQDGDQWIGHLESFPDYWTQGESLEELETHLKDLYNDLSTGQIPCGSHARDA